MPIEQSESKLVQNVTLLSNVPTPSHNYHQQRFHYPTGPFTSL